MKIQLTDAARVEFETVLSRYEENPPVFRIFVKGYSWGGPLFDVGLDGRRESDYAEEFMNTYIVVDQFYMDKLEGFNVDYVKNFFNKGFSIRPFKYSARC